MSGIVDDLRGRTAIESYSNWGEVETRKSLEHRAADEIERLRAALVECQAEIDSYITWEYPADHPVHERNRKQGFAANPARVALQKTEHIAE